MNQNPQYFQSKAEYWFFFVSDNWLVVVGIWWGKHLAFLGRHVLLCWPGDWDSGCLGSMGFVITDRGFVSGGGKKRKKECLSDQRKSLHSHFDWSPRKDQAYTPLFTWNLFFFPLLPQLLFICYLNSPFLSNMSNFVSLDTGFGTAHLDPDHDFYPSANPLLCGTWNHALPTQTTGKHPFRFSSSSHYPGTGRGSTACNRAQHREAWYLQLT